MDATQDRPHLGESAQRSRVALEQSVRHSWALFDALADSVSDALLIIDGDAHIEFCNMQTERVLGYAEHDLAGRALSELFLPSESARLSQRLAEVRAASSEPLEGLSLPMHGLARDGAVVDLELRLRSVGFGSALFVVALRDTCGLPTVEGARRARSAEDSLIQKRLDRTPHSTALLDGDGRLTAMNDAWHGLGAQNEDRTIFWADVGESFLDACSHSSSAVGEDVRLGVEDVLSGARNTFEQTYRCHSSTHLRWFKLQTHSLDSQTGSVLVTQTDVTDVQLAYARLKIQSAVSKAFNSRMPMLVACRQLALALCEELDWDFAGIWTLDSASWTLRCVDTWVRPELGLVGFERASRQAGLSPGTGLPGRAWTTAEVQWVTDLDVDSAAQPGEGPLPTIMPPTALRAGFRTALCFPLKCGGDALAVLEVFSRISRPKDEALMELLEVSGDQLALWELRERAENSAVIAQEAADRARAQLESVLDCTPAFITAIDRSGKIMFVNKTIPMERKAAAMGVPWQQYILKEYHAQVETALRAVFTSGASTAYEAKIALPDGKWLWFANYMGPMRDAGRIVGAVIVSQDVTDSKRSHEELLAAQRLAAVGTLAAGVAHEINTPIQFVNDSIHFLRDATKDVFRLLEKLLAFHRLIGQGPDASTQERASAEVAEAEEAADLEYMHENVPKAFERCIDGLERVATIVSSMKEFAHPAQKEMAPTDINRAILATLTVARNEYKYVADLETCFEKLPSVICHANDINQVVLNVVVNAAHAIADFPQPSGRGRITVTTKLDGGWVVISIADTGGGIPEGIRQRIFDPFFTTKEVGRGTGQGLSIAWTAIKEKHGGELSFDTELGVGTTFHIRLPIEGKPQEET